MQFEYLSHAKEITHNTALNEVLEKYKNKLKKYRCLEVGAGILNLSIPVSKYFRTYYAIEPMQKLYEIGISNMQKHNAKIHFYNTNLYNFMENTKRKFRIMLFINSFHFINFDELIKYTKDKYIIVILPRYDCNRFGDSRLNSNSNNFDEKLYNKNKINLQNYEKFILDNYKIIYSNFNEFSKIFIAKLL
jgi:hypothetical protein